MAEDLRDRLKEELPRRLEEVRKVRGYKDLKSFYKALEGGPNDYSYAAVLNYHGQRERREPPTSYLLRVSEVTGARLEWLITGDGPMFPDPLGLEADLTGLRTLLDVDRDVGEGRTVNLLDVLLRSRGSGVLPRAFRDWLPDTIAGSLTADAILALRGVCARVALGGENEEILASLGRRAAGLLDFPFSLGFKGHPSSQEYTDYVLTVSNALMQAVRMAAEGERTAGQTKQQGEGDQT